MAVINHSVIIRNWGRGIVTIYLTVAVPIFSNCRKSFITPSKLLYRPVYPVKSRIYEKARCVPELNYAKWWLLPHCFCRFNPTVGSGFVVSSAERFATPHSGFKFVT